MALLNPGDEVLVFEPFYGYHVSTLKSLRVTPVLVALAEPDWALDLDALRAAITPAHPRDPLNTPANPSGKVFTRAELEAIAASPRSTTSSSSPMRFTSTSSTTARATSARHAARHEGAHHRDLRLQQDFFVTGWRLGYVLADARWMGAMAYFHDLTYVCAPSALQHGAAAGLEQLPPSFYTQLAADHQSKRARILSALATRA
jgi:aminotransferase